MTLFTVGGSDMLRLKLLFGVMQRLKIILLHLRLPVLSIGQQSTPTSPQRETFATCGNFYVFLASRAPHLSITCCFFSRACTHRLAQQGLHRNLRILQLRYKSNMCRPQHNEFRVVMRSHSGIHSGKIAATAGNTLLRLRSLPATAA